MYYCLCVKLRYLYSNPSIIRTSLIRTLNNYQIAVHQIELTSPPLKTFLHYNYSIIRMARNDLVTKGVHTEKVYILKYRDTTYFAVVEKCSFSFANCV